MSAVDTLRATRKLLTPTGAWTQCASARDAHGGPIAPYDKRAVCWCLEGAMRRVTGSDEGAWLDAFQLIAFEVLVPSHWNDLPWRSQEHVLAMLDNLIARQAS